jgi:predicted enzyme related to lactoylglutathione lyase
MEANVITGVSKVVVPVDDQQKAKDFWTDKVGFVATRDDTYGDERWIEVTPPAGSPVLVLSPRTAERPRVPDQLPHSPVFFDCEDIQATYDEMRERGVSFASPPERQHFGWWALFEDDGGCRYALGQWS